MLTCSLYVYYTCLHIFWGVRVGGYWTAIVSLCLLHIEKLTFLLSHVFNMLFYRYICRFYELVSDDTYVTVVAAAYRDSCIWIFFGIWGQLHLDILRHIWTLGQLHLDILRHMVIVAFGYSMTYLLYKKRFFSSSESCSPSLSFKKRNFVFLRDISSNSKNPCSSSWKRQDKKLLI